MIQAIHPWPERSSLRKALAVAVLLSLCNASWAASAAETPSAERCKGLEETDFSGVQDAPTQIIESKVVDAAGTVPAFCRATGYVNPSVGIELRLPLEQWNGKFLEMGCGGLCGAMFSTYDKNRGHDCDAGLRKGYACIASDQGHVGAVTDGIWAYNNLQGQVDYAFRAAHVTALAGKAITHHYYGEGPRKSYFWGCSGGGREGMVEAQRFPWDFDGITVVAPGLRFSDIMMNFLWRWKATTANGKSLFSPNDVAVLHQAAMAKCDTDDGVKDGVIGNPLACKFDPSTSSCKAGQTSECLSPSQVEAAKKIYAGPTNSKGELLFPGALAGEEGAIPTEGELWGLARDYFRYVGFMPAPGPTWKPEQFDFDRDPQRLLLSQALLSDTNPDLRKFKAAGGKLILAHGWSDALSPLPTIDYYETVQRTLGGPEQTRDFFRLFLIPGMGHCSGGDGAYAVDYLSYLESWVEKGQAPDVMTAAHVKDANYPGWSYPLPANAVDVTFTRPVYPYPSWARYKGKGDPNAASSFEAVGAAK